MAVQSPEESALSYALARRIVTPQQVAEARAAAAAGRAPSALSALAAHLDPQQRTLLTQVYQAAQATANLAPTVQAPPPLVSPTVNTPPPQFGSGVNPLSPTVQQPASFQSGQTLQAPSPGTVNTQFPLPPGESSHAWGAPEFTAPLPPGLATAPTRPLERDQIENSLANSVAHSAGSAERIGDFEVVREIARGGVGVVYLARHPTLERFVALKLLLPDSDVSSEALERFKLEAQVASRLQHPNIVRIYQDGHDQRGRYYFAMDYIEGPSLLERIERQGVLESRAAATLMLPLAQALAQAHRQSVLHRDLKPHNVLLRESDSTPFLTDFGLAKDVGGKAKTLTVAGNVMGTPAYMPPEQAGGETDLVDRRSDVYSFGATLYHALTGQAPHGGQTLANVLTAVLTKDVVPPRKRVKGVDPDLETICMTCLESEQDARYASAQALADDLERYLADKPILARPVGLAGRVRRWGRRNRGMAWTLSLSGLVLVGGALAGGAYVLNERGRAQAEARRELISERRQAAEAARNELGKLAGADPEQRLAAALDSLSAAQQYYAFDTDDPAAAEASCAAALALADAAIEAQQLTLAERALSLAGETGVLAGKVRQASERLVEVRQAPVLHARRLLDTLPQTYGRPGWRERAVFELSRTPSKEWVDYLIGELEQFDTQLKASTAAALNQLQEGNPQEAEALAGLVPAWNRVWDLESGAKPDPADVRVIARARDLVDRAATRGMIQAGRGGVPQKGWKNLLQEAQELEGLNARVEVVTVALSRQRDHSDPRLRRALIVYLWHVIDEVRQAAPAIELLRRDVHPEYTKVIYSLLRNADARGPLRRGLEPFVSVAHAEYMDVRNASRLITQLALAGRFEEAEKLAARFGDQDALGMRVARCRLALELGDVLTGQRLTESLDPKQIGELTHRALGLRVLSAQFRWAEIVAQEQELLSLAEQENLYDHADTLVEVYETLGQAAARCGRFELAENMALRITGLSMGSGSGFELGAFSLMAQNKPSEALYYLRQGLNRSRDESLRELQALCYLQVGQVERARSSLRRLVEDAPHNRTARALYGQVLAQGGDIEGAHAQLDAALTPYPHWVPGLIARARVCMGAKDESGAREAYDEVVSLVGTASPEVALLGATLGKVFGVAGFEGEVPDAYSLSMAASQRGDFSGAIAILEELVRRAPENQLARFRLASLLFKNAGDAKGALQHAERAAELDPRDSKAWTLYGAVASTLGERTTARQCFERALKINPRDGMTHNNLGYLDREAGDVDSALKHYSRAIELDPTLVLVRCNRATLLFQEGRVDDCLEDFAVAVSLSPDDTEVRIGRAEVLLTLGRDREAIPDLEVAALSDVYCALFLAGAGGGEARLREHAQEPGEPWSSRLCLAWLGELSAEKLLEAARADPEETPGRLCEAHFYLGWQAERNGDMQAAAAHYQAAIEQEQLSFMEHGLAKARLSRLPR